MLYVYQSEIKWLFVNLVNIPKRISFKEHYFSLKITEFTYKAHLLKYLWSPTRKHTGTTFVSNLRCNGTYIFRKYLWLRWLTWQLEIRSMKFNSFRWSTNANKLCSRTIYMFREYVKTVSCWVQFRCDILFFRIILF